MWNIGTLAGEVGNPRRDFPRAIAVLIPLVFAMTVFPLATSVSIDRDLLKYEFDFYLTVFIIISTYNSLTLPIMIV